MVMDKLYFIAIKYICRKCFQKQPVNSGEQWVNSQDLNCSPLNLLYYLLFIFLVNSVKS